MKFLRIPILKNACEGLILLILISGLLEAEIMNKTYGGVEIKNIYDACFIFWSRTNKSQEMFATLSYHFRCSLSENIASC